MTSPKKPKRRWFKRFALLAGVLTAVWLIRDYWPVSVDIDYSGPVAGWEHYGNDAGGTRYSPLTQITPKNVKHLEVAWTYNHGDVSDGQGEIPSTSAFEGTPIIAAGSLIFPTPFNRVIALNPETGEEKWVYDPEINLGGFYANQMIARGVVFWVDSTRTEAHCRERIFSATNDAFLFAIDAHTGTICEEFGDGGKIDLNPAAGEQRWQGEYQVTSAPVVLSGHVIVGSAVSDNDRISAPSGVIRAFDAVTGDLVWDWDLRPPGVVPEGPGFSEAGYLLGTPNVWGPMSADFERDLIFVPTGNPAPDYFGGVREDIDYYGSSVVALRGSTGEVVWHFQTVHHDLWDYDVAAQPTLTTVIRDGEEIPVVIQATKMGLVFVLHRETGEPVFPVEERSVPQTDVPGEYTSPTQPFPVKPLPLVPTSLTPDDAWGPMGIGRKACREAMDSLRYEGFYTPPALGAGAIMYPGNAGGSNWGGVAVDPERQIMVANVMDIAWVVALIPREASDLQTNFRSNGHEVGPQTGTPYAMRRKLIMSPLELPCNPPPWGTIAAVDLHSGDILWQDPFGTVRDLAPVPLPIKYGVPNLGGPIVTGSGLIFIGASMDDFIRAFDVQSGKELWKQRLPAGGQATPMTYRLHDEGKQFVVIGAGGNGRSGTTLGDAIIAYTLP